MPETQPDAELANSLLPKPTLSSSSESMQGFHSVGGVVFKLTGSVPKVGSKVQWNGLGLEVVDMDGYRIDKILVTVL